MAGTEEGTPLEEALELSKPGVSALEAADGLDFDDDDDFMDDGDLDDGPLRTGAARRAEQQAARRDPMRDLLSDPDLADLNNPDVLSLAEPPMLGSRGGADLFGNHADTFGRATSPKLYASAGQHPNCVQFRVWRMENGIPVGLGPVDAEATEEDFVRVFYSAMPKPGEGRFQFRCRPIDQRGNELGKEFIVNISEHNVALRQMREMEKRRMAEQNGMGGFGGFGGPGGFGGFGGRGGFGPQQSGGDVIVQGGGDAAASMAEEMGRMFESAVTAAEDQTKHLQATLEMERDRLREEEKARAEERVALAQRASDTTEKMMERLMHSDRSRSEEAMKAQKQHSDLLMTTLTTVFSQQQEASRSQSDRMREQDAVRLQQDREYFERQRQESEERRRLEREEYERKREHERDQAKLETQKREAELALRLEREKLEMESKREEMRQERERQRQEAEERRQREVMEFERKMQLEREERERRERSDRDRWEREKLEAERKRDEERREWERREQMRREEMTREADRRREEMQLQMKQMEVNAQRDREHAERMSEMSRLEREAQREAALQREKTEREAREQAERDRQRQFELQKFEMEQAKERDREHAERMLQMSKMQQSGGLSGLTDMLGMETPELLGRIFGGGDDDGGSWTDAIPKMLGGLGELGKAVMAGQAAQQQQAVAGGRVPRPDAQQRIPIQTPQGVRMITVDQLRELRARQEAMSQQALPVPVPAFAPSGEDEEMGGVTQEEVVEPGVVLDTQEVEEVEPDVSSSYAEAVGVQTTTLAKAAGLSLKDMRAARKALRSLAQKMSKAEAEEWEGLITAALIAETRIFAYIQAVSAYAAFAETKADPELVEQVIAALQKSEMVPEGSIPYTQADLRAQQEAEAQQAEGAE